jgi:hypothetical protein
MPESERREFLKAALAAMATAGIAGCKSKEPIMAMCYSPALPIPAEDDAAKEKEEKRAELTEQLKKLGEEEPTHDFKDIGAMCYRIFPAPSD